MPSELDSTAPNGDVENDYILSDSSSYVKKKLSRQADEGSYSFITKDSDGTELSMEQAEYFKDSQVLDYADNLLVMYQLDNEELSDLDRSISTGFVFTENKQRVRKNGELLAWV